MSEIEYGWKTIEEMAQMAIDGKTVDFTFDTPEELEGGIEPSDWFGLKLTNDFDGTSLVVGYYGGGIEWACALNCGFNTMLEEVKFGIEKYLKWYCSDFDNRKICVSGYNTLIKKKESNGVTIALVDRHTKDGFCRYVVAWNYDCDSGTWGQGHYFTDKEAAESYYETEYH